MVKIHSFPRFQTVTRDSDVIGQKIFFSKPQQIIHHWKALLKEIKLYWRTLVLFAFVFKLLEKECGHVTTKNKAKCHYLVSMIVIFSFQVR